MLAWFSAAPEASSALPIQQAQQPDASQAAQSQGQIGQGSLKSLSLEQLGDVEITTVSKLPEQVWKTAAAVYVITQDDIRRSGVTSIPEALRLAPGVEVARIDGSKWSIGIRGFGSRLSRSVLVLIDGRNVYTTLLAGTYWEVQDYVLEDIDRIEVIRGPGGTVWGPNAVDGVINIITKSSKDTHGTLVTAGGGNEEQGMASVRYGSGNGKGLNYRAYLKGFDRGPEHHSDGDNFDRWRAAQGGFRIDWDKDVRNAFTLQGDAYDEGAGEQVQATSYTPPYSQLLEHTAFLSGGNVLGRWTRTTGEGQSTQLQVYYDRTNRREPNFGDLRDTFDADFVQALHWGSRQDISWGAGARASRGHELEYVSGLIFFPTYRTDQLYTGFFQDNVSIVPNRLVFELGTKILHTNYTSVALEPSARILWTPTDTTTVWAAATRAVRTPSDGEEDFYLLGYVGQTTINGQPAPAFARFNANPGFQPEKLNSYEVGFRRLLRQNLYVDLAGFFNRYHDLFSEDVPLVQFSLENTEPPVGQPSPGPYAVLNAKFGNGLLGTTTGGEIAPDWKVTNFWRLRGSYSFLHMAIRNAPGSVNVEPGSYVSGASPQHQVMIQSSFDLPRRFGFDFDYRYISSLPAPNQLVPAYSTANARLSWKPANGIELSAVGEDLFQPYHIEFLGDPGPAVAIKRSYYGKIVWRSKEP